MARTLSAGLGEQQEGLASVQATLHRTLTAYRAASGRELSKVYVAGNLASNPELPATLSEALGLEVQSLALPPPPGSSQEPDPAFMRAAALAGRATVHERRINLRQGEFAPPHAASALRNYLRLGSACAVTIALSLAFAIASQRSLLLDEQTRLKERLGRETKAVLGREVSTAKEARKLLKSIGLSDDPLPSFDAFDALEAVSASIDEDVTHDVRKLRIDVGDGKHEGRFELLAALGTIEQRDQVAEKLKAHKCFHEVEKGRTTPAPGRDRINYRLEGTIRCWESRPQDKKRRKRSKRI
ncbi:MAG: hypothetical protein MJD61_21110, partial [Proteobacteria bacterium]|nr:hypothetical protein [Pseudomonadota bacterium]